MRTSTLTREQKLKNCEEWICFWRENWDIFAMQVLQIPLKPFQRIILWLCCHSDVFFAIASRGLSKTFIAGVISIVVMCLYPNSEVVVTSSTVNQANIIAEKKIDGELFNKLSPYLHDMYEKGFFTMKKSDDGWTIKCELNNSRFDVLPCTDAARGNRATLLIAEEVRLLKKHIWDDVFTKMAHPRQAAYLQFPEYAENPKYVEQCRTIYITSARLKTDWFFKTFKSVVTGYYNNDPKIRYNFFAGDIFLAIDNGLKTWGDYWTSKNMGNEAGFQMEDLNIMLSETEDCFFTLESFTKKQIIQDCFEPPTLNQIITGNIPNFRQKDENEIRILASDYAFANTVKNSQKNDNTFFVCMALQWEVDHFIRRIEYCETHEASDSLGAADRARELIHDFDVDYYVMDARNGGEILFNYLTIPKSNPQRGKYWNSHGLGLALNCPYQIVPQAKLDDFQKRTVDQDPYQCIIPFQGTADTNHAVWVNLKKQLELGNMVFPISADDKQTELENSGDYFKYDAVKLADTLMPYLQTDAMILEAVSLSREFVGDKIKLVEPRSGTKDRVVTLGYANYVATLIENEWNRQRQDDDFDDDDWQLVW